MESITLYYKKSGSDKVYQVSIQQVTAGCLVHFAFGRRGTTLQTGTKTSCPVPYERAKSIYSRLVQEKIAKGYSPGGNAASYRPPSERQQPAGILPQLLNPVESSDISRLLADSTWCMQEKFDGKRMLIRKQGESVRGVNRNGFYVGLSEPIGQHIQQLAGDLTLDGECVGEKYVAFDLLEAGALSLRQEPYLKRLKRLLEIIPRNTATVSIADTVFGVASKEQTLRELRMSNKEGAVFKKITAPYTEGRPSSGGDALKFKFYETAIPGHRSEPSAECEPWALGRRKFSSCWKGDDSSESSDSPSRSRRGGALPLRVSREWLYLSTSLSRRRRRHTGM